jgi:hypothetical protein
MAHNPYNPPEARVADEALSKPDPGKRPRNAIIGLALLGAVFAYGVFTSPTMGRYFSSGVMPGFMVAWQGRW